MIIILYIYIFKYYLLKQGDYIIIKILYYNILLLNRKK